jgi:hypothetical protein
MNGALFESRATQLAKQSTDLLGPGGRIEVLEHLLFGLEAQGLLTSAQAIIAQVREQVYRPLCLPGEGVLALRERLSGCIERFQITEIGMHAVELRIPEGASRIQLLKEVADLGADLFRKQYVHPVHLQTWAKDARFIRPARKGGEPIRVEVNMPESKLKTFAEQKALNFNEVSLPDLIVAHAAYFLKTERDLFGDNSVWCSEELLKFYEESGLGIASWRLDRANWITASRYLSPEPVQNHGEGLKRPKKRNLPKTT